MEFTPGGWKRALSGRRDKYFWILAILSAMILLAPIRKGDLAGYDDASYAHIAKDIVRTGNWIDIQSNGYPALEHPPLLPWMQAALFSVFGFSDMAAKLPSALCGLGTILLVYWLGRRLLGEWHGVLAMLVMAGSVYFIKYAARAMTDVPITFFFVCAICSWVLTEDNPRWYLAAGAFTGLALLTRGLMGLGLPVIFGAYLFITSRRPRPFYAAAGLALALAPLIAWYAYKILTYESWFWTVHMAWLDRQVYGALSPPWRRYTGGFEYAWMLTKSYWPWLPVMIAGLVSVVRNRDHRLSILVIWVVVVFGLCAVTRSRVLRYMLPAYPAFAILASIGLLRVFTEEQTRRTMSILIPVLAIGVTGIALFPPARMHAAVIRPIAAAATAATSANERVGFYDEGQPRFDETNQMQWYGDRYLHILLTPDELVTALTTRKSQVFVVDRGAYKSRIEFCMPHQIVTISGHLVCVRLTE